MITGLFGQTITFSLTVTPATDSSTCDGTITVSNVMGGCLPYMYTLNPGNLPAGPGPTYYNLCGQITYTLSIMDNCLTTVQQTACVDSNCNVNSIKKTFPEYSLIAFDNITNSLYIDCSVNKGTAQLIDLSGKIIFDFVLSYGRNTFDLAILQRGIYIVDLKNDNRNIVRQKIAKN